MIRFIESHGKISKCQICLPCGDDFALLAIDYCHMAGIGNIYKNSFAVLFQLEGFRMSRKFDRTNLFAIWSVDDRNAAAAKSDINLFRGVIISNIVCIIFEVQFSNRLERFSVVNLAKTAFVICDKETIKLGDINDSLRCAKAGDRANSLAFTQIQHLDSVVAKSADK